MEFKEIEVLIDKINSSEISLFEVKMDNFYIKMDKSLVRESFENKNENHKSNDILIEEKNNIESQNNIIDSEKVIDVSKEVVATTEDKNFHIVKSPMVGTFYIAPGVDLDPYVKTGSNIKKGDTLCIIEAMKLMNELESDIDGEIVDIFVNDGEMVEYGSELFKIRR